MKPSSETEVRTLSDRVAQLEQENRLLEEVLGRNARLFEALLSNSHDGIALTAPDRRIVRVIKGVTGIDPDSLIGVPIESLAIPEDRKIIVDAYERLVNQLCGKITITVRVPRPGGIMAVHKAVLTDMLDNPNVQGIVWNYSAQAVPKEIETITK